MGFPLVQTRNQEVLLGDEQPSEGDGERVRSDRLVGRSIGRGHFGQMRGALVSLFFLRVVDTAPPPLRVRNDFLMTNMAESAAYWSRVQGTGPIPIVYRRRSSPSHVFIDVPPLRVPEIPPFPYTEQASYCQLLQDTFWSLTYDALASVRRHIFPKLIGKHMEGLWLPDL